MAHPTRFEFGNRKLASLPHLPRGSASHGIEYSDTSVVGLKLTVGKTRKSFNFRYVFRGAKRSARIGEFPGVDVAEARRQAVSMRALLDRGCDPLEARDSQKAMPTFREYATNDYLPIAFQRKRSADADESKFRNHLFARFGNKRLCDITRRDVELYHAEVRKSHTPATANRHLALIRGMFRKALEDGLVDRSPCTGVRAFAENNASTRWLSTDELLRLDAAMRADRNQVAAAALKFLVLTGARRSEASKMKWAELDLDRGIWLLHGDRAKNGRSRRIVLSGAAVQLLLAQPSRGKSEFVFPGRGGPDKPIDNLTKPLNRMLAAAGIPKARVHDLRHTHASHLVANGVSLTAVRDALGHASMQMTNRYAHVADTSLRQASEVMAGVLAGAPPSGTTAEGAAAA